MKLLVIKFQFSPYTLFLQVELLSSQSLKSEIKNHTGLTLVSLHTVPTTKIYCFFFFIVFPLFFLPLLSLGKHFSCSWLQLFFLNLYILLKRSFIVDIFREKTWKLNLTCHFVKINVFTFWVKPIFNLFSSTNKTPPFHVSIQS